MYLSKYIFPDLTIISKSNLTQTDGIDYNFDPNTRKEKERETSKFGEVTFSDLKLTSEKGHGGYGVSKTLSYFRTFT
jgi:hypothetical protein